VKGDCFEMALRVNARLPDSIVVHGLPLGTGAENLDKRYWHAWIEVQVVSNGKPTWAVADWSNDLPHTLIDRVAYYRTGRIPQHLAFRYTPMQAIAHLLESGHAGPWHPKADELEEVSL
jgi:hypothetical protein